LKFKRNIIYFIKIIYNFFFRWWKRLLSENS